MEKLQFVLYSREGDEVVRETSKVVFRNPEGEVCVLPNHARYFTRVEAGEIRLEDTTILTEKGYLIAMENKVTVLVERAQDMGKVNVQELEEEIEELSAISPERLTPLQRDKLDWLKKVKKKVEKKFEG